MREYLLFEATTKQNKTNKNETKQTCVPKTEIDRLAVNHHIGRVVVKHRWDVLAGKGVCTVRFFLRARTFKQHKPTTTKPRTSAQNSPRAHTARPTHDRRMHAHSAHSTHTQHQVRARAFVRVADQQARLSDSSVADDNAFDALCSDRPNGAERAHTRDATRARAHAQHTRQCAHSNARRATRAQRGAAGGATRTGGASQSYFFFRDSLNAPNARSHLHFFLLRPRHAADRTRHRRARAHAHARPHARPRHRVANETVARAAHERDDPSPTPNRETRPKRSARAKIDTHNAPRTTHETTRATTKRERERERRLARQREFARQGFEKKLTFCVSSFWCAFFRVLCVALLRNSSSRVFCFVTLK